MPQLQALNLCYQHGNGDVVFNDLSFSLTAKVTALIGINGCGKSILASILAKQKEPSSGTVICNSALGFYEQMNDVNQVDNLTIVEAIGLEPVFKALHAINQGQVTEQNLSLLEGNWDLEERFNAELVRLGINNKTPNSLSKHLSGGQLSQLKLWALFTCIKPDILILDEPSNHLDTKGKSWLIKQIHNFKGQLLLISHDQELLEHAYEVWELTTLGLTQYGTCFSEYQTQKQQQVAALENKLNHVVKQQSKLKAAEQLQKQKAQKRAGQGAALRKSGSQPKVLIDAKKDKASANLSSQSKNTAKREGELTRNKQELSSQLEQTKAQQFYLAQSGDAKHQKVLSLENVVLAHGTQKPLNLQVFSDDKIHVAGANGTGKSTLLKTLTYDIPVKAGQLHCNQALYYLDQHFTLINNKLTLLENVMTYCNNLNESTARTLLASIGFRKDAVFKHAAVLSGGEKMKLAMCIVSNIESTAFLLLDEPDNHLDLESKQHLAQSLQGFKGGFILVSHDKYFVESIGCNRQIGL
ncbi:putative ABC transporter ATP-binding protein YheS [Pseudoalteromonas sp. P1-26]|uniref:ATP-binding cassette domain-containing protein n=1 Tax=Pseudoalteromonas sp. P1-26 TaxID=1723759 RepID=UPI0006D6869B|nr:ATP-binding cassette domain-containing protein [Pseudoalteromonas sp. P1-26]KPZ66556.1 putative ABC transporter ATP-binding protein YheS [Pseudoalteromonas sp. P1-26]